MSFDWRQATAPWRLRLVLFALLLAIPSFLLAHLRLAFLTSAGWAPVVTLLGVTLAGLSLDPARRRRLLTRTDWPLWLFLAALSCSFLLVGGGPPTRRFFLHLVLLTGGCFYLGKGLLQDKRSWVWVSLTVAGAALVVAVYGLLEVAIGANPLHVDLIPNPFYDRYIAQGRPVSTQINPAPLATYLLLLAPLTAFGLWSLGRLQRALSLASLAAAVACLLLTLSRGGFLGASVFWICFSLLRRRYRLVVVSVALLSGFVLVAGSLSPRTHRLGARALLGSQGATSPFRADRTAMAVAMWRSRPVFGVGLLNYSSLFDRYYPRPEELHHVPAEKKVADNTYLTLLAETGVAGLVSFFLFVASPVLRALAAMRRSRDPERRLLLALLASGLAGVIVNALGYELLSWTAPCFLLALSCGFLAGVIDVPDYGLAR